MRIVAGAWYVAIAAAVLSMRGSVSHARLARVHPMQGVQAAQDTTGITPKTIDDGRRLFHGRGGCFACHGADLQGSGVAPPLQKKGKPWLAATGGEYAEVLRVITHGVPGTLMMAHPNGIDDAAAKSLAAYIWAVNHRGAAP